MFKQFGRALRLGALLFLLIVTPASAGEYGHDKRQYSHGFSKKNHHHQSNLDVRRFHREDERHRLGWHHSKRRNYRDIDYLTPEFADVSVHDPSVVKTGDTYYLFGSHLAAARSTDLVQWEMVADGVNESNPLFNNVVTELSDIFTWSDSVGLWANDVVQLNDGRFLMYPNLSRLDSPRASLGLAAADNIEGPYTFEGIFLQSGMWGEISEDGVNVYDPGIHPNTVDPHTFYGQQGRLWMVYGSYSGGIFILQMDAETGMPLPDQGYGKHLMGGNHSRIEGAYILYSPDTGYYYMFVSFGGLGVDGGYNIRVARSLQPDGPYFDAQGHNMADVKADPSLPLFDDASIEPYAQKLMGNFLFERKIGEPGTGIGTGYVSPGHNSAVYDEETDRYFLIFHTRFPGRGEFHQVRVHEMFMNEDGWPVVAPHRYAPRKIDTEASSFPFAGHRLWWHQNRFDKTGRIGRHEAAGDYKLINHQKDISAQIKTSQFISLQRHGRIKGELDGR